MNFGQQPAGGLFGQPAAPAGGLFGQPAAPAPAAGGGLFGQQPAAPAAGGSLFGQPAAPAAGGGLFGQPQQKQQPGAGGLFGQPAAPAPAAGGGLFGQQPAAPAAGGGLFGQPAAPAAGGGLFGQQPAAPAAGGGLFGQPQQKQQPAAGGLFGQPAAPAAGGGLFGQQPAAPAAGGGLFGQPAAPAAGGGLFGQPQQKQQPAGGGLFGQPAAPAPAAGGGLFGQPAAPAAGGGLFGQPAAPAAGGGLFGQPAAPAAGSGLFGQPQQKQQPTGGGLFGQPAAPAAGGGLFGQPAAAPAAGGGLFGQPAAPAAGGGLFGQSAAPAAGGGLFGQSAAPAAGGGLFGQQQQQQGQGQQAQGFSKGLYFTFPLLEIRDMYIPGYTIEEVNKFVNSRLIAESLKKDHVFDIIGSLIKISLAYNPLSPKCRFKYISYSKIDYNGSEEEDKDEPRDEERLKRIKKASKDACGPLEDDEWERAYSNSPSDDYYPVVYRGFNSLKYRCDEINETITKLQKEYINPSRDKLDTAQRKSTFLTKKIVYLRKTQAQLEARLTRAIAGNKMFMGRSQDTSESSEYARLTAKLELLRAKVCDHQLYEGKIRDLDLRSKNVAARCPNTSSFVRSTDVTLSKDDLATLRTHLMTQQDSIIKLSEAVANCQKSVDDKKK